MSSPEMMVSQVERWIDSKQDEPANSLADVRPLENELASLGEQLGRHNKAYGAGLFTMEQLREYTQPIKDRIVAVELQISNSKRDTSVEKRPVLPQKDELELFADEARSKMLDLSFPQKRAILLNTVDRIVGTPSELQIYGSIPINNHVDFKTSYRHGLSTTRHRDRPLIPFELRIKLPPPLRSGVDYGFLPGSNVSQGGR
jgi:site-specific DNA recombinase